MQTMTRRTFLVGAASTAAVTSSILTAPAVVGAQGQKVTLTFWNGFTGGDRPTYEAMVDEFNKTHPGTEVTMDIQPWDTLGQKLPEALATGTGPDIACPGFNPATMRQYAKAGTIVPIDDVYGTGANKVDKSVMPKSVIDAFTYDGKIYAVPANFATLLLYYNKDLLTKAGISEPPKTMEEFRADAVKLTKGGGSGKASQYGVALADHDTIAMWPILIWAEGGDLLNQQGCAGLADPKTVAAVKLWADLIVKQGISPIGETGQGADNLFAANKAAMEMNGPWAAGEYTTAKVNFDVAPIPVGPAGPVTLASTVPMVLSQNSKHKDAAYEFFAWWTGREAQTLLAQKSGFPPVRTDMANDATLAKNPLLPKFSAAVPYARIYLPHADNFTEIDSDVISTAIGRITRGAAADSVLKEANKQMNALLPGC